MTADEFEPDPWALFFTCVLFTAAILIAWRLTVGY
jgi:hypothetical protein